MKIKLLFAAFAISTSVTAQGVWTQKADMADTGRYAAVAFSIGSKGYFGTGGTSQFGAGVQDFWEWEQSTNVWTQKANFDGTPRLWAVGFSIGTKGYVGTGYDGVSPWKQDFWEWDQMTNMWTQKADFAGPARGLAVGFSIGNKGYIGTGREFASGKSQDFWEWDQSSDVWTQKADFAGGVREQAFGFSIGTKGYIGTGVNDSTYPNNLQKDFWEWDQPANIWTKKNDFGGTARVNAACFSIGTKGYVGTGGDVTGNKTDLWEWNQSTDVWSQVASLPALARYYARGFSIGSKGYLGTGFNGTLFKDFWEYDPNGNGVNEIENIISISVFPNPSTGIFTIKSEKAISIIEIMNLFGEKVCISANIPHLTSSEIDLRNQPKGIYFYKVTDEKGQTAAGKIIIQ